MCGGGEGAVFICTFFWQRKIEVEMENRCVLWFAIQESVPYFLLFAVPEIRVWQIPYQNNQLIILDLQNSVFLWSVKTWTCDISKQNSYKFESPMYSTAKKDLNNTINIWKMVKHCCYGGCNSNSKRHDVKFIPFVKPTSNLQRCRRWVHLCGRDSKIFNYSKITKVS